MSGRGRQQDRNNYDQGRRRSDGGRDRDYDQGRWQSDGGRDRDYDQGRWQSDGGRDRDYDQGRWQSDGGRGRDYDQGRWQSDGGRDRGNGASSQRPTRDQPIEWHDDRRGEWYRETRHRSRERHENRRAENSASYSSSRNGNGATSWRLPRNQPVEWREERGGQRGRETPIDRHENSREENGASSSSKRSSSRSVWKTCEYESPSGANSRNVATSRRQARYQPMEWHEVHSENRREECIETLEQPFEEQSKNQRQRDSSENRRKATEHGLVPGIHTITPIMRTKPDTASKQGTSGKPLNLVANYFQISKPAWQLYLYRVDFSPDIENKKFQNGLLYGQIEKYGSYIFDGTMLYMMVKLEKDVTEFTTKGKKDDQPYLITIKLVGLVSVDTYQYLHVWALILRKCEAELGLQLVGRNYYDAVQRINLPSFMLQLWPGFVTAIHQHERDILLCADISTKVMRTDTVLDIYNKSGADKVLDMTVLTIYNNKTYKVSDIDLNQCPMDEFPLKTGEKISYIDYFRSKYGANIRYPRQPMLIVRSSQRQIRAGQSKVFALVPELCIATGFDDDMRKNPYLMKAVAESTRLNPRERLQRSQALIDRLLNTVKSRETLDKWKVQIDRNPVQFQGRQLMDESVIFGKSKQFQATNWSRQFHINEMYVSEHLLNWVFIYPVSVKPHTRTFVNTLQVAASGMNYRIENPTERMLLCDESSDYIKALTEVANRDPQMIVCVLPYQDEYLYGCIKKYCMERAITSQILVSNTIKRGPGSLKSVATKVAIQINCKLGGVPWMVNIRRKGLMTIGFDVYHNIKNKNKKSCGAMVATMDMRKKQKYYSAVSEHVSGNDLSKDLNLHVCQAVRAYKDLHEALPENILFYRDGVGEGQIPYVKEEEVESIMAGLSRFYGDKKVPLTFIVVTKRTNTRFFVNNRGFYQNPPPGTVVDDVITVPERHDFFLVSSSVSQGTVSPTNYNILLNNMGLSSDELQKLTNQMTYLYYNWCGTLTVPAVCQYAHRLAFLVGNYNLTPPSNHLQTKLYFL